METVRLAVYYDYLCPYANRACLWLDEVAETPGAPRLEVEWRPFSLEEVNRKDGGPPLWERPLEQQPPGLRAFRVAEASRRQGEEAFRRVHRALFAFRHRDKGDFASWDALRDLARAQGLDPERFERDLQDPTLLEPLARSHSEAVRRYGVFGTPTLMTEDGNLAYLKMRRYPPGEALTLFRLLIQDLWPRAYIEEVKRPRPPAD